MLDYCKITGFADEISADIEEQIRLLKELDIHYMELRSAGGKGIADYTETEARGLKEVLQKNGIKVSAIASPVGKIRIAEDFEAHFAVYKNIVELAKIFETPYIRIFSFYIPYGEQAEQYDDAVMDRMTKLVDYARKQKVVLLHENEKEIYGDTAQRCRRLFNEFYGEAFRCTFDFANFVQCGQDVTEAYRLLKEYIEYVHIKDAKRISGDVVPAGEGDGNITEILRLLELEGYRGFLSLEPHLAEFQGLKQLETRVLHCRSVTGGEAFKTAYEALVNILALT